MRIHTFLGISCFFAMAWFPCFAQSNPWSSSQVIQPAQLAQVLKTAPKARRPVLLHVGFAFLYKNGHIPGSIYAGPAKEKTGLARLRSELRKIPRTRELVIYCGCCPMGKCPNVRPAFEEARAMGFRKIRILSLPDNFESDWIDKGYPVEK